MTDRPIKAITPPSTMTMTHSRASIFRMPAQ